MRASNGAEHRCRGGSERQGAQCSKAMMVNNALEWRRAPAYESTRKMTSVKFADSERGQIWPPRWDAGCESHPSIQIGKFSERIDCALRRSIIVHLPHPSPLTFFSLIETGRGRGSGSRSCDRGQKTFDRRRRWSYRGCLSYRKGRNSIINLLTGFQQSLQIQH